MNYDYSSYYDGTFKKHKLKDKKIVKRKGYYLNPITYCLEEC